MTDKEELVYLRVSVARIAQAIGVETKRLPVLTLGTRGVVRLATHQSQGWNDLAAMIADRLREVVLVSRGDAAILAAALKRHDTSDHANALILKLLG